jgi:polyphosphate kinase
MPRNFHRRVEVMVPVEDVALRARLIEILAVSVNDNVKSWRLASDGSYVRVQPKPGAAAGPLQARFIEMTRDKVKGAEAAGAASGRFYLMHARPQIDPTTGRTPRRREPRKTKES